MNTATTRDLLTRKPERLVVSGFRNIMAAYELADASCWEAVWQHYIDELGAHAARRLVGELQFWARSIRIHTERPLTFFPQCCRHLCHDECMALSIVSASQARDHETGLLAARYLTGSSDISRIQAVWHATIPFGDALSETDQPMYPVTCEVVRSIFAMQQQVMIRTAAKTLN